MNVDFIICGTQKGGTSALDVYLRGHPNICMAEKKEVHFFDNEDVFRDGTPDYSQYHSVFKPNLTTQILGEATPIYMYWRDAPRRMWQYNPNLKLIVLLRDPIDRAYSHWNMKRVLDAEALSFWEAIEREPDRCREALPYQHRVYSYVDRGFYLEQLRRLWSFFPKERVLVLKSDELKCQPVQTLQRVCEFLNVDPLNGIEPVNVHSRPYKSPIGSKERQYLRSVFELEIRGLERVLGWDCSSWLAQ
jgi:sulfotransferase family protein